MGLFSELRQARRDDAELGKGLWRRAHDRFRRGLDRFHQVLDGVSDDALYAELLPIADELAALLPRVRVICVEAQRSTPSDGLDIPPDLAPLHRLLSRAGNDLATAAQAATMARLGTTDVDSVRRRAAVVGSLVSEAEQSAR
ncbi:hypothetical protein QFZ52_000373 [Arthrobacter woluwensis]|uniref:hypothetical protein n=1 Tax=Arthrobacter woluwensis TaxID=156980 RepID=UPI00278A83CE|nr:hypothetical protein [Arthrobacter woluwensis]MDQ0707721.1 hypothetical protein [Arthrobacter woluwensis]